MARSNGGQFSTYDADHDGVNCASYYGGGFWYYSCADALITASTYSSNFKWYTSFGVMYLNAVEVALLC